MRNWSTAGTPPDEQYAYWREVLCEAFTALDPVARSIGSFESSVAIKNLVDVTVSDVSSREQLVNRGVHEIRRTPSEYFFANLQLRGQCVVRQDGRECLVRPGEFYIVDTTRVYELDFSDWRILCIRIPRRILLPLLKSPRESTAVRMHDDGSLGTIAGSFMRSVMMCPETISPAAQQIMIGTLANLLSVALGATTEAREQGATSVRHGLRDAIVAYAENNLSDPELSSERVAAHFRISSRYLQKLFEGGERTFTQLVLDKRLERCARDLLSSTADARSISAIAYKWGFIDFSNFCRTFRLRFGMSARDYRKANGQSPSILLS